MPAVVMFVTCPDSKTAESIARTLVERRLAACGNVAGRLTSIYRWKGTVHRDSEVLLILKTTRNAVAACTRAIKTLHPYDVPEIIAVPIASGLPEYLAWIDAETRSPPRRRGTRPVSRRQ